MQYRLSCSKLILFQECPRCFWLSVKQGLPRPAHPLPSLIYALDFAIKNYFNKYRQTAVLPPLISLQIKGKLLNDIPKTLQYKKENGVILNGRLDDIFVFENGAVAPLDHKTRSKPPENIHIAHQTQMDIYSLLLMKNNYQIENKAILLYFYPDNLEPYLHNGLSFSCKVVQVKTNPSHAEELLNNACNILDGPMPESNTDCCFCKWTQALTENTHSPGV